MSRRNSLSVAFPSPARRLRLEALEQRILLAVTTGFTDGVLTITGDGDADAIALSTDSGAILLNDAAITDSPTTENTDSIVIQGGAGDDVITIDLTGGALAPVPAVKKPVPLRLKSISTAVKGPIPLRLPVKPPTMRSKGPVPV